MVNKLIFILSFAIFPTDYLGQNEDLPVLGDYSSASISLSGEYELGRLWLSMYRGSTKEFKDP